LQPSRAAARRRVIALRLSCLRGRAGLFFAASIALGQPTVIEFGAKARASCKEMRVILDQLRLTHGEPIGIAEVDLLEQREAIRLYRIQVMPTRVFFDGHGRETGRHVGVINGPSILARLGVKR